MSVRKVVAETSREALKLAREQLGSDAVILNNRQTSQGVELLAIAQRDLTGLIGAKTTASQPMRHLTKPGLAPAKATAPPVPSVGVFAPPWVSAPAFATKHDTHATPDSVMAELKSMRGMLEQRLEGLVWDEAARRRPLRDQLLQRMLESGFSPLLARHITEHLPDDYAASRAEQWLRAVLAKNVSVVPTGETLTDRGGVYALVGPTGVGKTTTTAKLAARCVVKYGTQGLALISTDHYRIGAQDQLRIYAKILGVTVHMAPDSASLTRLLDSMGNKHLILIDTVGLGQRDNRLAEQKALFVSTPVQRLLLLNATSQLEILEDVVQAYRGPGLAGAILAKIDEAVKLGAALDVLIRNRLTLHYGTNGQRVPEDLVAPNSDFLIDRALRAVTAAAFVLSEATCRILTSPRQGASNHDLPHA